MSKTYYIVNTSGTTDGSDAAGAVLLSAVAGGIGLAWADSKDLWAEGGVAASLLMTKMPMIVLNFTLMLEVVKTTITVNDEGTNSAAGGITAKDVLEG